jgi:hypothetical protein
MGRGGEVLTARIREPTRVALASSHAPAPPLSGRDWFVSASAALAVNQDGQRVAGRSARRSERCGGRVWHGTTIA